MQGNKSSSKIPLLCVRGWHPGLRYPGSQVRSRVPVHDGQWRSLRRWIPAL